ncbi:translation initiation factor eIF2B delta subunit [Metarhizium rileyi]|uniref:Translation initiation factor eIF2B subunit delta n=1 Tax=Metarhizium rileyi (strain RCEF 4871) TaxID=1649241 RepID=A0A167GVB7_METRR|nr:translation initiation factor eIF2B delta subunit [Metarhizium rileyi RCEF 4871]
MAAEGGQLAPAGDTAAKKDPKPQELSKKTQPKDQAASSDAGGEKKLSNAELKKRAKEEKAARRAQSKAAQIAAPAGNQGVAGDAKSAKGKANQLKQGVLPVSSHQRSVSRSVLPSDARDVVKPRIPECFSHLSMARRIPMTQADKDVNPVVLALGQQMSAFAISDSTTRLEATLLAFKKVIEAYTTPHGNTFSRHFTSHVLNPQIEYLTACRPMCFSMGNAIRWLKLQISKIDIDLPDSDAKKLLIRAIDNFVHERIVLADFVIVKTAADMVENDDVILTYAHHKLVERSLLRAKLDGKQFKVILVDDPFDRVGLQHAKTLAAAGIPVTYASDMGVLRSNLQEATVVLAAAEAMFSNGSMYARAGTCDMATMATDLGVRVVALSETINFTERVSIDSLTYNEIDPERSTDEQFRLLFDTTRDKFISVVVTELGNSSAMSVPAILRKLEEL